MEGVHKSSTFVVRGESMRCIVLAAGMGVRMNSKYAKVTHTVCGKPMIRWILDTVLNLLDKVCVVVGHDADSVKKLLPENVEVVHQSQQLGTGHAVMSARNFIDPADNLLILYGDMPLITEGTIQKIINSHNLSNCDATVVSVEMNDPTGYGRIVRDKSGKFVKIVEESEASNREKAIVEVNTGVYIFNGRKLLEVLPMINCKNKKGEYYLTDVFAFLERVNIYKSERSCEFIGINNRIQLAQAEKFRRQWILEELMIKGVTIVDPETTYIDADVKIGRDSIIYPMSFIHGDTKIGEDCIIGPMTRIIDSYIGDRVTIVRSECKGARIMSDVSVGPFSRLREGTVLCNGVKIGNFVEIKNSEIDQNTKAQHLTYLGDAVVGKSVNIGAGTITCNFDGKRKNQTVIEDEVFIGSNTALVAPVKVEKGAFVAAGSTINRNVPAWSLAIARARQEIKLNWVIDKRKKEED
ncbi:MAG: bifunctional UDP-N-acetylglucosamine pyrophosphorylase / glucosamine-phosphate N-acetyltransferase [Pseudothermotoga sp.]|nr:MAG: Bifunctional protein GlmU [Pseudothermotoga lettingae]MDI3494202.1 bifunctional UDP-N-acetylglucosamine pyrophosphorylase / glucosamine-phosphate N-acetyltransferase [Pseudothermotoga sp.]MDK2884024.1 bifunctional UDP-N-acetylglucosamine pyrophosphorylase / glucosamine-phosphate N-acetyltransferase [Pseudothermotoga sp.]